MSNYVSVFIVLMPLLFACSDGETVQNKVVSDKKNEHWTLPKLPESVFFCGAEVKLDNFDVKERMDKELIVNTFFHSSTIQSYKRSKRYFPIITEILKQENVPEDFKYLCLIESGLTQAVSPSGAKGFWQFMPLTAKEYELRINGEIDERLNIEKSTRAACRYLKDANSEFNDWLLTAASYNRGVGGVKNALKDQGVNSYQELYLPNETNRYVFRILALKRIFENEVDYGFDFESLEHYDPIESREIDVNKPIKDLKQWALDNGSNYRMIRLLNPWLIGDKLSSPNLPQTIKIPA